MYKEMTSRVQPACANPEALVKLQAERWLTSIERISSSLLHHMVYNLKYPHT